MSAHTPQYRVNYGQGQVGEPQSKHHAQAECARIGGAFLERLEWVEHGESYTLEWRTA